MFETKCKSYKKIIKYFKIKKLSNSLKIFFNNENFLKNYKKNIDSPCFLSVNSLIVENIRNF